jgi:hypothetical protein
LFQFLLIAQHFSGNTLPIIRSSKSVIAASGFTGRCDGLAIAEAGNQSVCETSSCNHSFELLMMGGVSPETC